MNLPVMVTHVSTKPLPGVKEVIVGGVSAVTVKLDVLVAVPAKLVTLIGPVVAPPGTHTNNLLSETELNLASFPLNFTVVCLPARLLPVTVTSEPAGPLVGLKDVMDGGAIARLIINRKNGPLSPFSFEMYFVVSLS